MRILFVLIVAVLSHGLNIPFSHVMLVIIFLQLSDIENAVEKGE